MTAIALTIAGSDSSGGAGIQADLKTFAALEVCGASVIAALTAQNTQGVAEVMQVPRGFVLAQMRAVAADLEVRAIKIGMLGTRGVIEAVAEGLNLFPRTPVVLDPVMVAGSGDVLLESDAIDSLRTKLLPLATLITPNLPEAATLLGEAPAIGEFAMRRQVHKLLKLGPKSVLLKGGHAEGSEAVDLFAQGDKEMRLAAPRINTRNTHGTGCTLSAAIAAELAKGVDLTTAVGKAKAYVTAAIAAADALGVGRGRGPLHHFHHWWGAR
jgi:hydroxymethylpyrimidine/phosphomethylpyrimidine kinase